MERNYTYKDHFKFGWGNDLYNFENREDQYWVSFGKATRVNKNFREECIISASLIAETATKPILVCYSGGIDSEIILLSMINAKVPCKAVIMRMKYNNIMGVNSHDISYALSFVKKHNIPYEIFDFDLTDFIRNNVIENINKYRTTVIGILVHCEIVKKYCKDYLCILGGGDLRLIRNRFNGYANIPGMHIRENEKSTSPIQIAIENNSTVVNRFFMYTPELMLSWLTSEDIQTFVKYETSFEKITNTEMKPFIIHKMWPEISPRPKYTGFENVDVFDKNNWNKCDSTLVNVLKYAIDKKFEKSTVNFQYNDLIKMLSYEDNSSILGT